MATAPLTDKELREALAAIKKHGSQRAAALALGIPRNTLKSRIEAARDRRLTAARKTKSASVVEGEVAALQRQLARVTTDRDALRARMASHIRVDAEAEALRDEIFHLSRRTPQPPEWLTKTRAGKKSFPGTPTALWSDFHWGEVISEAETAGLNRFDAAVARARLKRLTEKTLDLTLNHLSSPDYPGIVVALGGDMISGEIHPELAETNDLSAHGAVHDLADHLIAALTEIGRHFPRVFVPCVVGNHGRGTLKPRMKNVISSSFDWLLYCIVERHFKADNKYSFLVSSSVDCTYRIYNHRYLLTHGDRLGVKGGDGIIGLLGPIKRGQTKILNAEAQIGREFDTLVMGHWHSYLSLPGILVNGSLCGYNEYARLQLRAAYQEPVQALWWTHPEWGINWQTRIMLDRPPQAGPADWLSVDARRAGSAARA